MTLIPVTITAEVLEQADGRPVAYIDATAVAFFAYQQPDGAFIIDIYTRDDTASGRLRLLLDGEPLTRMPQDYATRQAKCAATRLLASRRSGATPSG
jgi:hypothetical protein